MLIFLDLDGVLRRNGAPLYALEADCLLAFETAVERIPGARIVITSSWREGFSLEEIRAHFSPDIRPRIVAVTPIAQELDDAEPFRRHREVLAYLEDRTAPGLAWVAVDDNSQHYPPGAPLILTAPERGFDSEAAARLAKYATEVTQTENPKSH